MPSLSRWAVRASLIHLLFGATVGAILLVDKGVGGWQGASALRVAHADVLLFGWMAQLGIGVAFWILPRFREPPKRGNVRAAQAAVVLINIGVLLVILSAGGLAPAWLLLAGRVSEAAGGAAFGVHAWPRVRGAGSA